MEYKKDGIGYPPRSIKSGDFLRGRSPGLILVSWFAAGSGNMKRMFWKQNGPNMFVLNILCVNGINIANTLPKTNIAPENRPPQKKIGIPTIDSQGLS